MACFIAGCGVLHNAEKAMQNGNYDSAIQLYSQYLKEKPDSPEVEKKLAVAWYKTGKIEKAEPVFEKILGEKANDPYATLYLALCYAHGGQTGKAIALFEAYGNPYKPIVEDEIAHQLPVLKKSASKEALEKMEKSVLDAIRFQEKQDILDNQGGGDGGCGC